MKQAFTPLRVALIAVVSLTTCGVIIATAASGGKRNDSALEAALRRPRVVIAAAVPPPVAPTPTPVAPVATPTPPPAKKPAPTPSTGPTGTTGTTGASGETGPTGATGLQTKITHVFQIVLASPGYAQTWTAGSYLAATLRPKGTLLTQYSAIAQADLPNYLAMVSGQPPNPDTESDCPTYTFFPGAQQPNASGVITGSGCVYPDTVLSIGDQLDGSRHTWRAYIEGQGTACNHPNSGQPNPDVGEYATRHNPFVFFGSALLQGDCLTDDLDLSQLTADLQSKTPNYAFIAPNLCDDGTQTGCSGGVDSFLQQWVPAIMASSAYKTGGLIMITFGGGTRTGTLLISPFLKPGGTDGETLNTYSLLRTTEDIFGLSHLAMAGQAADFDGLLT